MLTKLCISCGIPFEIPHWRVNEAKYCSRTCYGISCRGKVPKSAFKKGQRPSPKTEFKKGSAHRYFGKSSPALGKHWKRTPESMRGTIDKQKGIPRNQVRGSSHWNWQGGITPESKKERNKLEYKLWREAIFKRDNYTCVLCGETKKYLNADHIKPFALYPELRLSLDNGRTLCIDCHEKTETYKGKTRRGKPTK